MAIEIQVFEPNAFLLTEEDCALYNIPLTPEDTGHCGRPFPTILVPRVE
jgi:hypothetical protein